MFPGTIVPITMLQMDFVTSASPSSGSWTPTGIRFLTVFVVSGSEDLMRGSALMSNLAKRARAARRSENAADKLAILYSPEIPMLDLQAQINSLNPDNGVELIALPDNYPGVRMHDDWLETVDWAISKWLRESHPSALTYLASGPYTDCNCWWRGIEAADEVEWNVDASAVATQLPSSHARKASTWLAILAGCLAFEDLEDPQDEYAAAMYTACLCQWLHGFEAASGNSYNHFDPEQVLEAFPIDPFVLGLKYGIAQGSEADTDIFEQDNTPSASALIALLAEMRPSLHSHLLEAFGNDTCLFWTLYSAVWPSFRQTMLDEAMSITELEAVEYGEVEQAWIFVSRGWCEAANG